MLYILNVNIKHYVNVKYCVGSDIAHFDILNVILVFGGAKVSESVSSWRG